MFTIIGGDGKEYGPASIEQIRSWIAGGRANLETRAKLVGTDDWRTLGDFPEFNPAAGAPPLIPTDAPLAPSLPSSISATAAPVELAERGPRFLARFIDWTLEILCCLPGFLILGPEFAELVRAGMQGVEPDPDQINMARLGLGGLATFAGWFILLVVQVILLSTRGQSIGKIIAKVRVARLDGTKPGFLYAWFVREALVTLGGIALSILPFIGPLLLRPGFHVTDWCLIFRDDRRCLHDLMAGTHVVKA